MYTYYKTQNENALFPLTFFHVCLVNINCACTYINFHNYSMYEITLIITVDKNTRQIVSC